MTERDLSTMTNKELYAFKDRLDTKRDRIKGRRGPAASQMRHYCRIMCQMVDAILKGRGVPLRRPGSHQRVYGPGAAPWQKDAGQ